MNRKQQRTIKETLQILLLLIIVGLFIFGNLQYTAKNPGGNDFLVHWVGTQSFVKEGISPYSDNVALRIQNLVYGRPAQAGEHELRVAYPFYSVFIFLPFSLIDDFTVARALWMTALEFLIIFSTIMMIRMVNWKPKFLITFLIIVFSLFWYHGLRSIINGNAVVLILFLIILSIYAIIHKQDELAGICLAFITIKPQVVFAFIIFLVFWSLSNRRYKVIFWFFGSLIALIVLGLFIMPTWPMEFIREVFRYPSYNPPGTPATALAEILPGIGRQLGIILSVVSALILLVEWFFGRYSRENKFIWISSLTLAMGQWLNVQTDPGNFLIMFPAIILILRIIEDRWRNSGQWIILLFLSVLFFIPWIIFIRTIDFGYQPLQNPIMFFPVPLMLIIGLFWVRWWVKNPVTDIINS
ncbi:MAG: hypothetical protein CVU40_02500 [Chloroflexi bacterium HGW-Chloroflexi-2]|jgi:hypothetical protein|nr:MAG: hypothetical protein CVU40_02500 [Chloroflexi bacterium HGW-Chloroflexi-2]